MRSVQQISAAERALRRDIIYNTEASAIDVRVAYAVSKALAWARGEDLMEERMVDFVTGQTDRLYGDLRKAK